VIIDGESLNIASILSREGNTKEDFNKLTSGALKETEAAILLFSLSDQVDETNWLLLSFIPDGCKVRDKMLYSSSRDDLKRSLGLEFFTAEYSANDLSDVSWDILDAYLSVDLRGNQFLSETEKMVQEEKVLAHAESSFSKSAAMNVLPFSMSKELIEKIKNLKTSGQYNLVEMSIVLEEIQLVRALKTEGDLSQYMVIEEPR
jgi:twinfilin-like protein